MKIVRFRQGINKVAAEILLFYVLNWIDHIAIYC